MIFFSLFSLFLFALKLNAKPFDDKIVFKDADEPQSYISLIEESQILPFDESSRLIQDDNEMVQQELEQGQFFQGDIVLQPEQKEFLKANLSDVKVPTRTGWLDEYYRWPKDINGFVVLPYDLSAKSQFCKKPLKNLLRKRNMLLICKLVFFSTANYQKTLLKFAMGDIEKYTCVRFVKRSNEIDFVHIYAGDGCHSNLGKIGGQQSLSLQKNGCFSRGTIIHEFIHALGYGEKILVLYILIKFFIIFLSDHMHSHAERDKFVEIRWNNIKPQAISNFDKVDPRQFGNFGTSYDLYSLMHYDKTAFTSNGKDTIVPRNRRYRRVIGQRIGLSVGDVRRINNMYNCIM